MKGKKINRKIEKSEFLLGRNKIIERKIKAQVGISEKTDEICLTKTRYKIR